MVRADHLNSPGVEGPVAAATRAVIVTDNLETRHVRRVATRSPSYWWLSVAVWWLLLWWAEPLS